MNVYVVEASRRLAARGIEVDIFTRATSSDLPPVVEMAPGVTVRHVSAGPFEGLGKEELPAQLCAFTAARAARGGPARARLLRRRPLPLLALRPGRLARPRPLERAAGPLRAHPRQGQERGAGRRRPPRAARPRHRRGAGRRRGRPADRQHRRGGPPAGPPLRRRPARAPSSSRPASTSTASRPATARPPAAPSACPQDAVVLLFVGRIQPLKAPDVLLHAAARLLADDPALRAPAARARRRRPQRLRPRRARAAAEAGRRPRHRRRRPLLPAAAARAAGRPLPRRRRHRRPQPQRVLRPGRARVPGLRHPGRRRRRRRPARPRSATASPACSSTGTTRPTTPPPSARCWPARELLAAGARRHAGRVLLGPHRRRPRRRLRLGRRGDGRAPGPLPARERVGPLRALPGVQVAR